MQIVNLDIIENNMKVLGQLETLIEILTLIPVNWLPYVTDAGFKHFLGKNSPITYFGILTNNKLYELVVKLPTSIVQEYITG